MREDSCGGLFNCGSFEKVYYICRKDPGLVFG